MRIVRGLCVILMCVILVGNVIGCKDASRDKKQQQSVTSETGVVLQSVLLATIADDEVPVNSDTNSNHSPDVKPGKDKAYIVVQMHKNGRGFAYIAQVGKKTRVVRNGTADELFDFVETFTLTVSPDGQRVAYGARNGEKWYMVIDGQKSGPFAGIGKPSFSSDGRMVSYEAKHGENWKVHLGNIKSPPAVSLFHRPVFNKSGETLWWVENTKNENEFDFVISDFKFKQLKKFSNTTNSYVTSSDNEIVAAIRKEGGKQHVIEFSISTPDVLKKGQHYDEIRDLTISPDGKNLSYYAARNKKLYVVLNGKEEEIPVAAYPSPPVIRPDLKSVGIVVAGDDWAYVHQAYSGNSQKGLRYKECADIAYSTDSKHIAYVAMKGDKLFIVTNGNEGPHYDRVIAPQFSPDGRFVVYRARQDGKRFVVVADALTGKVIKEHPRYERVFETVFTEDGSSVAYGVMDGKQLWWKVEKL